MIRCNDLIFSSQVLITSNFKPLAGTYCSGQSILEQYTLFHALWHFTLSLWKNRNHIIHGITVEEQANKVLQQIHTQVEQHYIVYAENEAYVLPRYSYLITQISPSKTDFILWLLRCWFWSVEEARSILQFQEHHFFSIFWSLQTVEESDDSTYLPPPSDDGRSVIHYIYGHYQYGLYNQYLHNWWHNRHYPLSTTLIATYVNSASTFSTLISRLITAPGNPHSPPDAYMFSLEICFLHILNLKYLIKKSRCSGMRQCNGSEGAHFFIAYTWNDL